MEIRSIKNLVESRTEAHSAVIEADNGTPIVVVAHVADAIICSVAGDKDFEQTLQLAGISKAPKVVILPEKSS